MSQLQLLLAWFKLPGEPRSEYDVLFLASHVLDD